MKPRTTCRNLGRAATVGLAFAFVAAGCGEDGQDGADPVFETLQADEDQCEHGGTVFRSGFDTTGDGEIDGDADETVVCDSIDGDDGDLGEDGDDAIIQTSPVEPGAECEFGGVKIESGIDQNGDGTLSDDEVDETSYVCNYGDCSTGEPLDFELATDELPSRFVEGFTYEISVSTDADPLAIDLINLSGGDIDIDVSYDHDEGTLAFEHIEGLGVTDLAIVGTDGCDFQAHTVELGPYEEGLADIYFAHLASDTAQVDIVDANDSDSTYTTLDHFEFDGPLAIEWGEYEFDFVDADDDTVLDSTDEIAIDPFESVLIYAYEDDGELEYGSEFVDMDGLDDDQFRLQAFHLADDAADNDLGIYAIDDDGESLLFDELSFGDPSSSDDFDADPEAHFGLDTNGDGDVDEEYSSFQSAMSGGAILHAFALSIDDVTVLTTFDYSTATVSTPDD